MATEVKQLRSDAEDNRVRILVVELSLGELSDVPHGTDHCTAPAPE